ncbi:MAG: phage/plasmid replication protein [Rikenellaceae bacterium]
MKYTDSSTNILDIMPSDFIYKGEHNYRTGTVYSGYIGNLALSVTDHSVALKQGSLCKWYLGSNCYTMNRVDTQNAIEALSDILHVPMQNAIVSRLDVGVNIITENDVTTYFPYLGELSRKQRLEQTNGLYYTTQTETLSFYDKIKEQIKTREPIPKEFRDKNVLRYEYRLKQRIAKKLGVEAVKASLLYDKVFYDNICYLLYEQYNKINKINILRPNIEAMKNKKEIDKYGNALLVEKLGGLNEAIKWVDVQRKNKVLTSLQATRMRANFREANNLSTNVMVRSKAIEELDKKINDAIVLDRL